MIDYEEKVDPPTGKSERDVENEFSIGESSLDHGLVPCNTRWRDRSLNTHTHTHTIMGTIMTPGRSHRKTSAGSRGSSRQQPTIHRFHYSQTSLCV